MTWVQRNIGGIIIGAYANRQPGYADEQLSEDDPEVIAFQHPEATPAELANLARIEEFIDDAGVIDLLQRARTATAAQIDTWLLNNVTNLAQARTILGIVIKLLVSRRVL